jgi:hypothetical protein
MTSVEDLQTVNTITVAYRLLFPDSFTSNANILLISLFSEMCDATTDHNSLHYVHTYTIITLQSPATRGSGG